MYAGHVGVALGARSLRRAVPLWLLVAAAQLPDWLDAGMCVENMNRGPYGLFTHGVAAVAAAAVAVAVVYALAASDWRGGGVVAAVTLSHYPLDYLTGRKPTFANGPIIGLNLYSRPAVDLLLEGVVITAGWWIYRRSLPQEPRSGASANALLFSLLGLQIAADIALALNATGHVKC